MLLSLVCDVKERFLQMGVKEQSDLLNILFRKCPVKNGEIKMNWRPPFNYISTLCNMTNEGYLFKQLSGPNK